VQVLGGNRPFCIFEPPLGDLGTTYVDHHRVIGKSVVDFILVLTELFFAKCYGVTGICSTGKWRTGKRRTGKWRSRTRANVYRARFTLSKAMFRKNARALQLGWQTLFFVEKKLATFLVITVCHLSLLLKNWRLFLLITLLFTRRSLIFRHANNYCSFCGGPCSAEHAEHALIRRLTYILHTMKNFNVYDM